VANRTVRIVALLVFSVAALTAAESVSLASAGHKGMVTALDFDQKRGLLFSAGNDGTVRIWDASDGSLRGVLAISRHRMTRLAVNPQFPLFAVVEATGSFSARLSVWDCSSQKRVYEESLADEPLFLRWSSSGNALLFGQSAWDSLRMLRTGDWTTVASAAESEGIVGFAELSRNENTIMSYAPTGRIVYQSTADGNTLQEAKTVAYLTSLRLTSDRQYLLGATDRELFVLDAVSGVVSARTELPRIRSLDVSAEGDRILCIAQAEDRLSLSLWGRTDWGLYRSGLPAQVDDMDIGAACFGNGLLFAAGLDGTIWSVSPWGDAQALVRDACPDFAGMDLRGDRLALADTGRIFVLSSDFLVSRPSGRLPSSIVLRSFPNPFSAPADLLFLEDGRLLLWQKGSDSGSMEILDPDLGSLESGPSLPGGLVGVERLGARILTVEKGGKVRLTDLGTRLSSFEVQDPGMNAAAFLSRDLFVGGRSSRAQGALVLIDARTGETVGIPDRNRFVFAVAAEPSSMGVLALGVDQDGGTNLTSRWGAQLENETLIDRYPFEDVGASMRVNPAGKLFFLLGTERIRVWDGQRLSELGGSGHVPRSLVAASNLLVALNTDSTVSLWDAQSGEAIGTVTVFRDGEWAIVLPGGFFLSSRQDEPRVRTLTDGEPVPENDGFRIVLPDPLIP
jgi:WD40 repeat protein